MHFEDITTIPSEKLFYGNLKLSFWRSPKVMEEFILISGVRAQIQNQQQAHSEHWKGSHTIPQMGPRTLPSAERMRHSEKRRVMRCLKSKNGICVIHVTAKMARETECR